MGEVTGVFEERCSGCIGDGAPSSSSGAACVEIVDGLEHRSKVISLFDEYTRMLVSLDPSFRLYLDIQHYEDEIRDLEGKYAPPYGRLYLLLVDGKAAGCIALRRLDEWRCELKRLYVRPQYRGRWYSRLLLDRIVSDARAIGYTLMLLDSLPELGSALSLYHSYGFVETGCYNDSPVENTVFMELAL